MIEVCSANLMPADELCRYRNSRIAVEAVAGVFSCPRRDALLQPVDDYDEAITATEAAEEFGVHKSTILTWVLRGHLTPLPYRIVRNGRSVPGYIRGEVALAEKKLRDKYTHRRGRVA